MDQFRFFPLDKVLLSLDEEFRASFYTSIRTTRRRLHPKGKLEKEKRKLPAKIFSVKQSIILIDVVLAKADAECRYCPKPAQKWRIQTEISLKMKNERDFPEKIRKAA